MVHQRWFCVIKATVPVVLMPDEAEKMGMPVWVDPALR